MDGNLADTMDDPRVFRHTAALLSTPRRRDLIFSGRFGWLGEESMELSVTGKSRSSEPDPPAGPQAQPARAATNGDGLRPLGGLPSPRARATHPLGGVPFRGLPGGRGLVRSAREQGATLNAQRRRLHALNAAVAKQRRIVEAEAARLEASLNSMLAPYWRRGDTEAEEYVLKLDEVDDPSSSSASNARVSGESTLRRDGAPPCQSLRPLSPASARVLRPPSPPSALQRTLVPVRPAVDPETLARAQTEEVARRRRLLRLGAAVLDEAAAMRHGEAGAGRRPRLQPEAGNGLQALAELRRARTALSGPTTGSLRSAQTALRAVVARARTLLLDHAAGLALEDAEHLAAASCAGEPGLTPHEQLAAGVANALASEWAKLVDAAALQKRAAATAIG